MQQDPIVNLRGTGVPLDPYEYTKGITSQMSGGTTSVIDPLEDLKNQVFKESSAQNTITPTYNKISEIDDTGRYPWFMPGADNEELYGQTQSAGSKAVNAVWKGLNLAATTFLQGTVGLINGAYRWAEDGRFASFYDNEFNRALDKHNQDLENQYANYYTSRERDAEWWEPANLLTANFFFDKVVKNMGFTAGAIAGGAGWGALLKGMATAAKLSRFGYGARLATQLDDVLATAPKTDRLGRTLNTIKEVSDDVVKHVKYNPFNKLDRTIVAAFSTFGEGGIEALQSLNNYRQELIDRYVEMNGTMPSGEDLEKINETADHVGNWTMAANVGILFFSNYIQLPNYLRGSSRNIARPVGGAEQAIWDAEKKAFVAASTKRSFPKLYRGWKAASLLFSPSEAAEEAMQFVASEGSTNFWDKKYREDSGNFMTDLLGEGFNKLFSTKEGVESILIGGLSGGLMQMKGNISRRGVFGSGGREGKIRDAAIAAFNQHGLSDFTKTGIDASNRAVTLQEDMADAAAQKDILEYKNLENDYAFNYLHPRIKYGRYDLVKDDFAELKTRATTIEGFEELKKEGYAGETDTRDAFLNRLSNMENMADAMNSLYQSLNSRYANLYTKDSVGKSVRLYPDATIDKMVYTATKISDFDRRTRQMEDELAAISVDIPTEENIEQILADIKSRNLLGEEEDYLHRAVSIIELRKQREQKIREFNDLRNNPLVTPGPSTVSGKENLPEEEPEQTVEINGKNIFVGEEYFLGVVIAKDKNGKIEYRAPRLTILGKTPSGKIKIRDSKGKEREVEESEFENYKLGRVSSVEKNRKAKFFMENWDTIYSYNFGEGVEKPGRLTYNSDTNTLYFTYLENGNIVDKKVSGQHFVPQKDFKRAIIIPIGKVTASQQAAQDAYTAEKEDDSIVYADIIEVLQNTLAQETANLEQVTKQLDDVEATLSSVDEEVAALKQRIEGHKLGSAGKFRSDTRKLIKIHNALQRKKEGLEREREALLARKETLEFNRKYINDLLNNLGELPPDMGHLRQDLQNNLDELGAHIRAQEDVIERQQKLITLLEDGIEKAIAIGLNLIEEFQKKYPKLPFEIYSQEFVDFLNSNPNFLKLKPNFKSDVKKLGELIAQIEEMDIAPNERSVKELEQSIDDTRKELGNLRESYQKLNALQKSLGVKIEKQEKILKEQAEYEANTKLHSLHESNQKEANALAGTVKTGNPEEKNTTFEGSKKPLSKLFTSTTTRSANEGIDGRFLLEHLFLSNARKFSNRNKLQMLLFTQKTEASLGIPGAVQKLVGTSSAKPDEVIGVVFIENDKGTKYFVDVDGKRIGEVGTNLENINTAIFSTMPTSSLTWAGNNEKRYSKANEEEAKKYAKAWQKKREEILAWEGSTYKTFPFTISRGIAQKTKGAKNSVVKTLVEERDLDKQGLIVVSTSGQLDHNEDLINVPVGRPMIRVNDIFEWIDNRHFSEKEVNHLFETLARFAAASDSVLDVRFIKYLQGILYFGSPQKGAPATNNQIWVEKGKLRFGKTQSVWFTEWDIRNNETAIKKFLANSYNNVNNNKLTKRFNESYEEITGFDSEGNIQSVLWTNYQSFLLSPTYRLAEEDHPLNGKNRPGLPLLTTDINKLSGPTDLQFHQKYATIVGDLFSVSSTQQPAPDKAKTPPKKNLPPTVTASTEEKAPTAPTEVADSAVYTMEFNAGIISYRMEDGYPAVVRDSVIQKVVATPETMARIEAFLKNIGVEDEKISQEDKAVIFFQMVIDQKLKAQNTPNPAPAKPAADTEATPTVAPKAEAKPLVKPKKKTKARIIKSTNYTKANINEEKAWFETRFNIPFHRITDLIYTGGAYAFGKFQNAAIYIWENAEVGTTYHEAFHAVWSLFATPRERANIIKEFRGRSGHFIYYPTGESIAYSEATEEQVEEQVAEEARDFFQNNQLPPRTKTNFIRKFFTDLINFIRNILFGEAGTIEEIFKRMGAGYYKTAAPRNFVDLAVPKYRITDFNVKTSRAIVEGIVANVFSKVFTPNAPLNIMDFDDAQNPLTSELFEEIYGELKEYYEEIKRLNPESEEADRYYELWKNMSKNWGNVVENVSRFLRTMGIKASTSLFDYIEEETQNSEDSVPDDNENRDYREYGVDAFVLDFKRTAPASVKLLYATVTKSIFVADESQEGVRELEDVLDPETDMEQLEVGSALFTKTLAEVGHLNTLEEKRIRMQELAAQFPAFSKIYNRLFNQPDSIAKWRFLVGWFSVMSKQQPEGLINYVDTEGNSFIGTANHNSRASNELSGWIDALKLNGDFITTNTADKVYQIKESFFKGHSVNTLNERLKFLAALKIPINRAMYNRFSGADKNALLRSTGFLFTYLKKNTSIPFNLAAKVEVGGPFKVLAGLYAKYTAEDLDSTYFNIEKKRIQRFVDNNLASKLVNDINASESLEELVQRNPQYATEFASDSHFLNNVFFGANAKKNDRIGISVIQGTIDDGRISPTIPTDQLSMGRRLLQEINQNLNGNYHIMLPADSKTEWMLRLGNTIDTTSVFAGNNGWKRFFKRINTYYQTEKSLYEADGKARLFADISNNYSAENIEEAIRDFIENRVDRTFRILTRFGFLERDGDLVSIKGLDTMFVRGEFGASFTSMENMRNLILFRTMNYVVNNIEIYKLIFGDPAAYLDPTKRFKNFLSPHEMSAYDIPYLDNILNTNYNRVLGVPLSKGDPGYHEHKNYMEVAIVSDVYSETSSQLPNKEKYGRSMGTDAQSWATLPGYREILIKARRWSEALEKKYQFIMARDRQLMVEDGIYAYPNISLENADRRIVNEGSPNDAFFPVLKPIGAGFTNDNFPFLHKTSTVPLWYASVRGRNISHLYRDMLNKGVSYSIVTSGEKVGYHGAGKLYHDNGKPNALPASSTYQVPFKYYGIIVETGNRAKKQTRGSQLTKIASMDIFDIGMPIDYNGTLEEWEAISNEEDRKVASPLYKEYVLNTELLEEQAVIGYENILKTLGIEENNGRYTVVDKQKTLDFITRELYRREEPDNIIDALQIDPETLDFQTPFEAVPNYQTIRNILYSLVDKKIGSPSVNGKPSVQISSTGFETEGRRVVQGKDAEGNPILMSNGLNFYNPKYDADGNVVQVGKMEILLPNWFRKKLTAKDIYISDEELIKILNKSILTGIGFRIPTQGLNSVEVFEVVGFLPEEYGSSVVVPEEIVTKAGSDFDVDKLQMYLKNIYVTKKGEINVIPFYGVGREAKEKLNAWIVQQDLSGKPTGPVLDDLDLEEAAERDANYLDNIYRQSIENAYFDSLERLILHPKRVGRLLAPNSADGLKSLRDELNALKGIEKETSMLTIDPIGMSTLRHFFILGKKLVGIAAVQMTNLAVSQKGAIVVNPGNLTNIPENERIWLGDATIRLPHNTYKGLPTISGILDTEDEYISAKLSQYIDGAVDVAKDPFLVELGITQSTLSTYMLLEKLGVPSRTTIMFMNQPIIRKYLDVVEDEESGWLFSEDRVNYVTNLFAAEDSASELQPDSFTDIIAKYSRGEQLTYAENEQQLLVLDEFLKYAMMASHLFNLTQGSNYDTSTLNNPYLFERKLSQTERAKTENIFSSVDVILQKTFIGGLADIMGEAFDAMSEVSVLQKPNARSVVYNLLQPFFRKRMSNEDFLKVANKIGESFLSGVIQLHNSMYNDIHSLLVSETTSLVTRIDRLQSSQNSDIKNNFFLTQLRPLLGVSALSTKNVVLAQRVTEAFTADSMTESLRELYNNPHTREIFESLIKVAFLQSGVSKSPISFTHLIPFENFKEVVTPVLRNLENSPTLATFVDTNAFYRNNWNDKNIVPEFKQKFGERQLENGAYVQYSKNVISPPWYKLMKSQAVSEEADWGMELAKISTKSRHFQYPFITLKRTKRGYTRMQIAEMVKKGDWSWRETVLFKRVEGMVPIPYRPDLPNSAEFVWYYPVNAWGDGMRGQEYYPHIRSSQFDNGTFKPPVEFTDAELLDAMGQTGSQNPQPTSDTVIQQMSVSNTLEGNEWKTLQLSSDINSEIERRLNEGLEDGDIQVKCDS